MKTIIYSIMALFAFAANSVLCRLALHATDIDAASFTSIRILSASLVLSVLVITQNKFSFSNLWQNGRWSGAFALFIYAATFSLAYINLTAATGALILFGTVQITMLTIGFIQQDRFTTVQWIGFGLAMLGLVILFMPGLTQPPVTSATLMVIAGIAWGNYTLLGKGNTASLRLTQGNFMRCIPLTLVFSLLWLGSLQIDIIGVLYAALSGAFASGVGYAIWYAVLPRLTATKAATMQLSVPVIATLGGIILLDETLTWRILMASLTILGGVAIVILKKAKP